MKSFLILPAALFSLGLAANTAQAEDALSKIGRVAEQTSQKVQEAKDTRDVLTGKKTTDEVQVNKSGSTDPRKAAEDELKQKKEKLKSGAEAKRDELENHGQEVSAERHRINAERKAMKEQRKNHREKRHSGDHEGDHEHKDKHD